jgi:hypothetical protein
MKMRNASLGCKRNMADQEQPELHTFTPALPLLSAYDLIVAAFTREPL